MKTTHGSVLLGGRRCGLLGLMLAWLGTPAPALVRAADPEPAPAQFDPEPCRRDVEFLLKELPARAGHFFPNKGIDWAKVTAEFREEAGQVRSEADHVRLCRRLVARLRDGHAYLANVKVPLPDESRGRRRTGPHLHLLADDSGVWIRRAFGNAAAQGLKPGMQVAEIEGLPARTWLDRKVAQMRDESGYSTDHQALYAACHWGLADWAGTALELTFRGETGAKTVRLTRSGGNNMVPVGPVFPPQNLRTLGRQAYGKTAGGFGYIHLRDVPGNLPDQLDTMLGAVGTVPGLVLDLRANGGGGTDHPAVFGRFLAQGEKWRQYAGASTNGFAGPLVVIVDAGTRSAGETVAAMLKEDGRAWVIGDSASAGTSSSKTDLQVPSGLFAVHFSVASNMKRVNGGRGIEGIGIPPHEIVRYDPGELLRGIDSQIRRAEEILQSGLPPGTVEYRRGKAKP